MWYAVESTPTSGARHWCPRCRNVIGAEAWVKVATPADLPPANPAELRLLVLSTRIPDVAEFHGPDGGKTAHYMLRCLGTCSEAGPPALGGPLRTKSTVAQRRSLTACQGWSERASATIGA